MEMAGRRSDGKERELERSRTLNPHPEAVIDEAFASSGFFDARDVVQVKYEMVRRVEAEGATVSATASAFGFSRQSYYSAAQALADGGLAGLIPAKPGPRGAHKLTGEVLDHVAGLLEADPGWGHPFTVTSLTQLCRNRGIPSHQHRLRAAGMLTLEEIAAQLGVSTQTIKVWQRRGDITGRRIDARREHLYHPGQTRPRDRRRRDREPTIPATEHHQSDPAPEGIITTTPPGGAV